MKTYTINDFEKIEEIIKSAQTCFIGINKKDESFFRTQLPLIGRSKKKYFRLYCQHRKTFRKVKGKI